MKTILTVVLLVCSTTCFSQGYKVTIVPVGKKAIQRELDTVPIVILYSDTATKYQRGLIDRKGKTFLIDMNSHSVIWMKGFSIREKRNNCDGMIDAGINGNNFCQDYWEDIGKYLMADKTPLPDNYVVWIIK